MKTLLRIVAVLVRLAVVMTALMVAQFALSGGMTALARSGALGIATFVGWFIILTTGPVATVQLWRRRRIGLFVTAMLCVLALAYYVVGLVFLRAHNAPLTPILGGIVLNGVLLALLLSPAARRACS